MDNKQTAMRAAFPPALTASTYEEGYRPDAEDLASLYRHRFETVGGLVIDCYLEHHEGEEATDVSPGNTESLELVWALVGGIDISEVLGDAKQTIEEEAMEDMQEACKASKGDL